MLPAEEARYEYQYGLVLIRILGFKMLIFGSCFILYFLKLSAGIGF